MPSRSTAVAARMKTDQEWLRLVLAALLALAFSRACRRGAEHRQCGTNTVSNELHH